MNTPDLYRLLPEPLPTSVLGVWEDAVQPFTHVVGYACFGDFFLHNPAAGEFAVLNPERQAYKYVGPGAILHPTRSVYRRCGIFESVADWERFFTQDPVFVRYRLRPYEQAAWTNIHGRLGQDEIWVPGPQPATLPAVSGPVFPEEQGNTYCKANAWAWVQQQGRLHGLGSKKT